MTVDYQVAKPSKTCVVCVRLSVHGAQPAVIAHPVEVMSQEAFVQWRCVKAGVRTSEFDAKVGAAVDEDKFKRVMARYGSPLPETDSRYALTNAPPSMLTSPTSPTAGGSHGPRRGVDKSVFIALYYRAAIRNMYRNARKKELQELGGNSGGTKRVFPEGTPKTLTGIKAMLVKQRAAKEKKQKRTPPPK